MRESNTEIICSNAILCHILLFLSNEQLVFFGHVISAKCLTQSHEMSHTTHLTKFLAVRRRIESERNLTGCEQPMRLRVSNKADKEVETKRKQKQKQKTR